MQFLSAWKSFTAHHTCQKTAAAKAEGLEIKIADMRVDSWRIPPRPHQADSVSSGNNVRKIFLNTI